MSELKAELADLIVQATTERSHYYVRSVCTKAIDVIVLLESKLAIYEAALEKIELEKRPYQESADRIEHLKELARNALKEARGLKT